MIQPLQTRITLFSGKLVTYRLQVITYCSWLSSEVRLPPLPL